MTEMVGLVMLHLSTVIVAADMEHIGIQQAFALEDPYHQRKHEEAFAKFEERQLRKAVEKYRRGSRKDFSVMGREVR